MFYVVLKEQSGWTNDYIAHTQKNIVQKQTDRFLYYYYYYVFIISA